MTSKLPDVVVQLMLPDAPQVMSEPPALRTAAGSATELTSWTSTEAFFGGKPDGRAMDSSKDPSPRGPLS
jgi:hypothetical protein